jgi:hypothetical protein
MRKKEKLITIRMEAARALTAKPTISYLKCISSDLT